MVTEKKGFKCRSCPSSRILQLAQPKVSKTEWVTTPCSKLTWGNQESIWPLSYAALCATPTERIQRLAKHKRDFSEWDSESSRKLEEGCYSRSDRPTSKTIQYEDIVRLSTPKNRSRSSLEIGSNLWEKRVCTETIDPIVQTWSSWDTFRLQRKSFYKPYHNFGDHILGFRTRCGKIAWNNGQRPSHTTWCEHSCPIWPMSTSSLAPALSPRLIQLASPKRTHPDFKGNRETVETYISDSAKSAHTSPRLDQLSLPKMRESNMFFELGYPEEPIRPVSKYARRATATPRIKSLAMPKGLVKDYLPLRDPIWSPSRAIQTAGASSRSQELV